MGLRLSAHLGHMWQEMPLLDRVYLAADKGFEGVDIPFPYDQPAKELQRALMRAGLELVSISAPPPNYTGGGRGYIARPGAERRFQHDLRRARRYAEALGDPMIHLLTGPAAPHLERQATEAILKNLRWASEQRDAGVLLLGASPETALEDSERAVSILEEIGDPEIRLRLDYCDLTILGADAGMIADRARTLALVAVSGAPERACPAGTDTGLGAFFEALRAGGYEGWVSAAYPVSAAEKDVLPWRSLL